MWYDKYQLNVSPAEQLEDFFGTSKIKTKKLVWRQLAWLKTEAKKIEWLKRNPDFICQGAE
jgi:tRNA A37 N6-isopentenylltransferase MiaA